MCNDEHRELAGLLTTALADRGIELLAAHVVDRVATGGRWHCADGCGNAGNIDPKTGKRTVPDAKAAKTDMQNGTGSQVLYLSQIHQTGGGSCPS